MTICSDKDCFFLTYSSPYRAYPAYRGLETVLLTSSLNIRAFRHRGKPTWYCLLVAKSFKLHRMVPVVSITHTPTSLQICPTDLKVTCPDSVHHTKQGRRCNYNVTSWRVHVTTVALDKQRLLHVLECVVLAFIIQYAKRMRRVVLSSVATPALQFISTLSHKQHGFSGGGVT